MASISEILARFQDGTLPREQWTHAAHLAVALQLCRDCDEEMAMRRLSYSIKKYNAMTGETEGPTGGYHETMTIFFMRAVRRFCRENPGKPEDTYPKLLEQWGDKNRIFRYYSRRVLFHPSARAIYIEPDLQPLDF